MRNAAVTPEGDRIRWVANCRDRNRHASTCTAWAPRRQTDARAMAHLIEESEAVGVNAELPKLFKAMADRAIAAGHGGEQYPVLIEEFSKPGPGDD